MLKPLNYDQTPVQGEFTPIELGQHHLIIKQVNETSTKYEIETAGRQGREPDKNMIVVLYDFSPSDRQPGLLMEEYKNDTKPDKKWPSRGTKYIPMYDRDGNTARGFKTFCTCFERSNGTTVQWVEGAQWAVQFKNKKIGGAFGEVHSVYNGKETIKHELRWFVTDDKVDPEKIPNVVELTADQRAELHAVAGSVSAAATYQAAHDDFLNIPESEEENLPFK